MGDHKQNLPTTLRHALTSSSLRPIMNTRYVLTASKTLPKATNGRRETPKSGLEYIVRCGMMKRRHPFPSSSANSRTSFIAREEKTARPRSTTYWMQTQERRTMSHADLTRVCVRLWRRCVIGYTCYIIAPKSARN